MARRRSQNRRASRRSMNITELDQDTGIIDTGDDPMWWKNIEGDITVRQSRGLSYGEMTNPILSDDSSIDSSELPDEWWQKLDKTNEKRTSRRISKRQSVKTVDTPYESFNSDETDEISIKKRKVLLRAREKKSVGTETFLAVLNDLKEAGKSDSNQSTRSRDKNEEKSLKEGKRNRRGDNDEIRENTDETSANTSGDTDVIVKTRPKPFNKRLKKNSNNVFDDLLRKDNNTSGSSRINKSAESLPVADDSTMSKNPTKQSDVYTNRKESVVNEKNPMNANDHEENLPMGPPKSSSRRKRLSSISRKLDLTSDESENETQSRKPRLDFGKKTKRPTTSINPFDEVIEPVATNSENREFQNRSTEGRSIVQQQRLSDRMSEKFTLKNTIINESGVENLDDTNDITLTKDNEINTHGASMVEKNYQRDDLGIENSSIHNSEENREKENNDNPDVSMKSLVGTKILEVSLTRIDVSENEENLGQHREKEANSKIRFIRKTRRFIDDSAYELPDKERSETPQISESDSDVEKSLPEVSTSTRKLQISQRKINERMDYSRTKIFSDEDISIEDLNYIGKRTEEASVNKTRRNVNSNVSTVVNDKDEMRETSVNLENSRLREKKSRKSVLGSVEERQIDSSSEAETEIAETEIAETEIAETEIAETEIAETTEPKTRKSVRKNFTNKSQETNRLEMSYDEDESNIGEKVVSSNNRSRENSRKSPNKLQRRNINENIIDRDKTENTDTELKNLRLREKSPTIEKNLTSNKSQDIIEPTGTMSQYIDEYSPENVEKSSNLRAKRKSRKSQKILSSDDESQRDEIVNEEKTFDQSRLRLSEKSSKSGKSFETSKSQRFVSDQINNEYQDKNAKINDEISSIRELRKSQHSILSDESISENDEVEEAAKNMTKESDNSRSMKNIVSSIESATTNESQEEKDEDNDDEKSQNSTTREISRTTRKSHATNKSRESDPSDVSISEDEHEAMREIDSKSENSRTRKISRNLRESQITDKSRQSARSDESMSENEPEAAREINQETQISRAREISHTTRKSLLINNSRQSDRSDENLSEDEPEVAREINQETQISGASETSHTTRKSLSINKSRQSEHSDGNLSEDEQEAAQEINQGPQISRMRAKSHTTRKSLAVNKSRQSEQSDENLSEDEPEAAQEINQGPQISRMREKSHSTRKSLKINKSRQSDESDENLGEDEPEAAEEMNQEAQISGARETSRATRNSLALNKSRKSGRSDENLSEDEPEVAQEMNQEPQISGARETSRATRKSLALDKSRKSVRSDENLSEDEPEAAEETNQEPQISGARETSRATRKSLALDKSRKSGRSDENLSENEPEDAQKMDQGPQISRTRGRSTTRKSLALNKSRQSGRSDENLSENEPEADQEIDDGPQIALMREKSRTTIKSLAINESRQNTGSEKSVSIDESNDVENTHSSPTKARKSETQQSRGGSKRFEKIGLNEEEAPKKLISTSNHRNLRTDEKIDETTKPSDQSKDKQKRYQSHEINDENNENYVENIDSSNVIKKTNIANPRVTKNISTNHETTNNNNTSTIEKSDISRKQKNITDFFPSKFLQKTQNSSTTETPTSFDKNKLRLVKEKMDEMRRRETASMRLEAEKKKRTENSLKRLNDGLKRKNSPIREKSATGESSKKTKIIDKAYIVNGTVYKRPKLPRPKSWVTDRLYRHLWKLMEPKYKLSTRVKSEKFVLQLSEIVALTTRRKKYESYKIEVDELMREMAKLGIIKTRNDFYDFCYDFLPYDFRVKVTPILLPGNVSNIPYDPKKLHEPILRHDVE